MLYNRLQPVYDDEATFLYWPSDLRTLVGPSQDHSTVTARLAHTRCVFAATNIRNLESCPYTKELNHVSYQQAVHTLYITATAATSVSNAELCVLALGNPPAEGGPDHTSPKKSLLLRSLVQIESAFPRMKSRKLSFGASSCR